MKKALLALMLGTLVPAASVAQSTPLDTPPDSPLWWPLIDGVTAEDIWASTRPEAVAARYREAVASDLAPDCGPDFVPVSFASEDRQELTPMWAPLRRLVYTTMPAPDYAKRTDSVPEEQLAAVRRPRSHRQGLEAAGLSAVLLPDVELLIERAGRELHRQAEADWPDAQKLHEVITQYMEREQLESPDFVRRLRPGSPEALKALREEPPERRRYRAEKAKALYRALDTDDDLYLHTEIGESRSDWRRWLRASDEDRETRVMVDLLVDLRDRLDDHDWAALRQYLASEFMFNVSTLEIGFDSPCDDVNFLDWKLRSNGAQKRE